MPSLNREKLLCNLENWYKAEKDENMFNQKNLVD